MIPQEANKENTITDIVVAIKDLCKSFGDNVVLTGVNLNVKKGENLVVLGKSGSGKSITIKCLVGLIDADKGEIKILDTDITKLNNEEINKIRVRIGFLFQNAALYDSMTVRENLMFPLKRHKKEMTAEELEAEVLNTLDSVGLKEAIDKMPSELSGGMRKRIGLARTLILKPELMLYDEPTTGLDTITSREISELILAIQKKNKTTSIIITHDMACAKLTSDRIVILKDGTINAEGTYEELEKSNDEWVRSFFI
jgi:phospholipid/cholesterol/gamma-HCH transport system ATP-binding protein